MIDFAMKAEVAVASLDATIVSMSRTTPNLSKDLQELARSMQRTTAFSDEMIMDGIENCIRYCHNFDPEKSKNPFAYFTQIIYYAFLRRIEKEKKQTYIKFKMTENVGVNEELVTLESGERIDVKLYDNFRDVIDDFETKMKNKKKPITKTENSKNKKLSLIHI